MSEENDQEKDMIVLGLDNNKIEIKIKNLEIFLEKQNEIYEIADRLYRINSIFKLREKYSNLFTLLPNEILIHLNENNWAIWEKVLLLLFVSLNFESTRNDIWGYNISQSTLRGVIRERTDYIRSLDDDIIKLTDEGLKYIISKINDECNLMKRNLLGDENVE